MLVELSGLHDIKQRFSEAVGIMIVDIDQMRAFRIKSSLHLRAAVAQRASKVAV